MRRRIWQVIAGALALYLFALAGFAVAMRQPPERFAGIMAHTGPVPFLLFPFETMWKDARRGQLRPGDAAPDFTLPLVDRSGTVQLASLRGVRPVVLVFGSYT
jgi:hypothetical protein